MEYLLYSNLLGLLALREASGYSGGVVRTDGAGRPRSAINLLRCATYSLISVGGCPGPEGTCCFPAGQG